MKQLLAHVLQLAASGRAFSDIHVEERMPVTWRTPAGWQETGFGSVAQEDMLPLLGHISREWKTHLSRGGSLNRTIEVHGVRLRCCLYTTHARERLALTMRVLPARAPRLDELGLPVQVAQFATPAPGILLLAGATGSGKTTTIAALVEAINAARAAHIITIEDPVEVVYERKKAIITQREVDPQVGDVPSFADGLHEAMRQRPDIIVIGEIRDSATAEAALRAAESGHYVMASLHASSSVGALQKMMTFFADDVRAARAATLASSLRGVIHQTMVSREEGYAVRAEILAAHGIQHELHEALLQPAKLRSIEERLHKGMLAGSLSQ